jgi:hypothetical protein
MKQMTKTEINIDVLKLDLSFVGWGVDEVMAIISAVRADNRIEVVERVIKPLEIRIDEASR